MDRHSVHSDPIGTGEFLFVKKKILIIVAHAQKAIEGKKNILFFAPVYRRFYRDVLPVL